MCQPYMDRPYKSYETESSTAKRVHMQDGKLIGPEGGTIIIRTNRKGFWAGCNFVTWEAWDEIKRQLGDFA